MTEKRWLHFYPNDVDSYVTIEKKTLSDLLAESVKRFDSEISLEFYDKQWTYREVYEISERLAGCLYQQGFRKGSVYQS